MNEQKFNGLDGVGDVPLGNPKRPKRPKKSTRRKKAKVPPLEKYGCYFWAGDLYTYSVVKLYPRAFYGIRQLKNFIKWLEAIVEYEKQRN